MGKNYKCMSLHFQRKLPIPKDIKEMYPLTDALAAVKVQERAGEDGHRAACTPTSPQPWGRDIWVYCINPTPAPAGRKPRS